MTCQRYEKYGWWRAALAGEKMRYVEDEPHAGFYMASVTQGKRPFLPARIFWEGEYDEDGELIADEVLRLEIAGVRRDISEEWKYVCQLPVTEEEYMHWTAELFCSSEYKGPQRPKVRWLTDKG